VKQYGHTLGITFRDFKMAIESLDLVKMDSSKCEFNTRKLLSSFTKKNRYRNDISE
jgi:hypothetical protein